jgi:hypothetical protein
MEVDSNPGDSKCERSVSRPESEPKAVAILPQAFEQSACGTDGKCRQKYEAGSHLGEPARAPQVGRDTCKEGCGKPFSFVHGRGRYRRLGDVGTKFNSGRNTHKQSSSSNSNVWHTSDLLDALEDTKAGCDSEKSVSDASGVKIDHD